MTYVPVRRSARFTPPQPARLRCFERPDKGNIIVISCAFSGRLLILSLRPNKGSTVFTPEGFRTYYQYPVDDSRQIESGEILQAADFDETVKTIERIAHPIPSLCLPGPALSLALAILRCIYRHIPEGEVPHAA